MNGPLIHILKLSFPISPERPDRACPVNQQKIREATNNEYNRFRSW